MRKITLLTMFLLIVASLQADIKERLAKRLPGITKLKAALVIGEDNKGYLAIRGEISVEDKKIVDAENADRRKIYEMLAKKTDVAVEKVQSRRAEQIAGKSKKGIWLQKTVGTWYKK